MSSLKTSVILCPSHGRVEGTTSFSGNNIPNVYRAGSIRKPLSFAEGLKFLNGIEIFDSLEANFLFRYRYPTCTALSVYATGSLFECLNVLPQNAMRNGARDPHFVIEHIDIQSRRAFHQPDSFGGGTLHIGWPATFALVSCCSAKQLNYVELRCIVLVRFMW